MSLAEDNLHTTITPPDLRWRFPKRAADTGEDLQRILEHNHAVAEAFKWQTRADALAILAAILGGALLIVSGLLLWKW